MRRYILFRRCPTRRHAATMLLCCLLVFTSWLVLAPRHAPQRIPGGSTPAAEIPADCDDDCVRLLEASELAPPGRPKALIYYLTQARRIGQLRKSLRSLHDNFLRRFAYPVVIFHEEEFGEQQKQAARRMLPAGDVYFQRVDLRVAGEDDDAAAPLGATTCPSSVGYRRMCRFHAFGVYSQPALARFDYAWRLDDDSQLVANVTYDVFRFMRARGILYGYILVWMDATGCVEGLMKTTKRFVSEYNIRTTEFFDKWTSKTANIFYNNFEISALRVWRSQEYGEYGRYIDRSRGIFAHRWGDAPIKGLAVSMFIRENETHQFRDIGYRHASFDTTSEDGQGMLAHSIQLDNRHDAA